MVHSTLALSLLLIAVSSNLAMAIKKEKRTPQTLSRGTVYLLYVVTSLSYHVGQQMFLFRMYIEAHIYLLRCVSLVYSDTPSSASSHSMSFHSVSLFLRIWLRASYNLHNLYNSR